MNLFNWSHYDDVGENYSARVMDCYDAFMIKPDDLYLAQIASIGRMIFTTRDGPSDVKHETQPEHVLDWCLWFKWLNGNYYQCNLSMAEGKTEAQVRVVMDSLTPIDPSAWHFMHPVGRFKYDLRDLLNSLRGKGFHLMHPNSPFSHVQATLQAREVKGHMVPVWRVSLSRGNQNDVYCFNANTLKVAKNFAK